MAAAGPSRSLYEALGLEPDAADAAVRGAYKKAAVKWHPDKHVGKPSAAEAEARFREVQAAYAVLSDPAKRKKYDARGLEGLDEADLKDKMLSITSPIARGLIAKEIGEEVVIETPKGSRRLEILDVWFTNDLPGDEKPDDID